MSAIHRAAAILLLAGVAPAAKAAEPVQSEWPCEAQSTGGQGMSVQCTLPPGAQPYRFVAHFSGGHDDTKAVLRPTLDGRPLDCESGSKTRLFAEEGDISLDCRFSTPPSGEAVRFDVLLTWSCADYERAALTRP